jgi:NAD(P)-dependent dehydrogenase (short-subunit alcohol dehydrogenase family)
VGNSHIQNLFDLSNKVFLLVGGARDLGLDMARALCEAGAEGVITSHRAGAAESAAAILQNDTERNVVGLALDATDEYSVAQVVEEVIARFERIDILINNAGGGRGAKSAAVLEHRDLDDWNELHALNVTAPFLACKYVVPHMKRRSTGTIINIASIAGIVGRDRRVYPEEMAPQTIDYAAAKGAVIALSRDLAAYLGPYGIRVNTISPGGFERSQPQAFIDAYCAKTPLRRMGRDGVDIKGAAVFLASEASAYVTGHNLVLDGGFTVCQ